MTVQTGYMEHSGIGIIELVDFIVRHFPEYIGSERKVEKFIKQSLEYKTGDYGSDDSGIVYVVRFVIKNHDAFVSDLAIRKDRRKEKGLLKYIIARNWSKFPYLQTITFDRRKMGNRTYQLKRFFKQGVSNE